MPNNFQDIINKAVEVREKYSQTSPKQWNVEQVFMGMVKDVGDLSKILMVNGEYRNDLDKDIKEALQHELADILYCIAVIADKTGVDLEKSFWQAMSEIENKL